MSLAVNGAASANFQLNNSISQLVQNQKTEQAPKSFQNDSFQVSSTGETTQPEDPNALPTEVGGWKNFTNSIGSMFSNMADALGFGETRKLLRQEFNQVDADKNQSLNKQEFNIATLNLFDFFGTEFARADKNRDGVVVEKEYANYRKEQLSLAFDRRDNNMDNHLTVNEFGFIGRQMLQNRDVRLDENDDGAVNKREFTRASLRGLMNLRDWISGG